MMKYEAPEADIIRFCTADIVTASGGSTNPDDDKKDPYVADIFD